MTMETQTLEREPMLTLNLPIRESSRKRVKKSMGPDFIEDYTKSFKAAAQAAAVPAVRTPVAIHVPPPLPTPPLVKTAKKLNSILEKGFRRSLDEQVPPRLPIRKSSLSRPHACDECMQGGNMSDAFTCQDMMLLCHAPGCTYAVHRKCSRWNQLADAADFRCMECRQCALCLKPKMNSVTDLMCNKCNNVYHRKCYVEREGPEPVEESGGNKSGSKDWTCASCLGLNPRPSVKRKRYFLVSPVKVRPAVPAVTLNGIPATVAGNGSVLVELPKNTDHADDQTTDRLEEMRKVPKVPKGPRLAMSEKKKLKLLGPKLDKPKRRVKPEKPIRYDKDPLPEGLSKKLAAIRASMHAAEPVILSRKEQKRVRSRLEEDGELRQDMALWTVEQCAAYFRDSCPELSELITQHDLLGSALVIISRTQFLDLFRLPVGKALNMHAAVCRCRRMFF